MSRDHFSLSLRMLLLGGSLLGAVLLYGRSSAQRVGERPRIPDAAARSAVANFPRAGAPGRLRVSAGGVRGLWLDNGTDWISVAGEVANVKAFGARGDGRRDDGAAIQQAINSLLAGGVVVFPPGNYVFSTTLLLPVNGLTLQGSGKAATVLSYAAPRGTALRAADPSEPRSDITVRDLSLIAMGSGRAHVGVDFSSVSNSRIASVMLANFGTQLLMDGSRGATLYNHFDDVDVISGSPRTGRLGVVMRRTANAHTFLSCKFSYLQAQFTVGQESEQNAEVCNQIALYNCTFEYADEVALDIVHGDGVLLSGGRFEYCPTAVRLAENTEVRGVVIDGPFFGDNATNVAGRVPLLFFRPGGANLIREQSAGLGSLAAANLVPNGLMEGWLGPGELSGWTSASGMDWTVSGRVVRATAARRGGAASARIGDGTSEAQGIATVQRIRVAAGRPYTLSFWFAAADAAAGVRWAFRAFDAAGSPVNTGNAPGLLVSEEGATSSAGLNYHPAVQAWLPGSDQLAARPQVFERRTLAVVFPPGTSEVQLALLCFGGGQRYAYVDDVFFGEGPAPYRAQGRFLQDSGDQVLHGGLAIGGGGVIERHLTGTIYWDPNPLADGAITSRQVSVPGAMPGDPVTAAHAALGAADVVLSGHVQGPDTVRVMLWNRSGGTLNVGPGLLRVGVWKY